VEGTCFDKSKQEEKQSSTSLRTLQLTIQMKLTTIIALAAASPILSAGGKPSLATLPSFGVSTVARNHPGQRRWTSTTTTGVLAIRGGAVHESQTLGDLDSRIQSAALQDKLTVIDFTATW